MPPSRTSAIALAGALVAWKTVVAPRVSPRWLVPVHAALAGVLVTTTDAQLGLGPPALRHGVRLGLTVAGAVAAVVAPSTAVPSIRRGMQQRELPRPVAQWLLVRIPLGTVWSEEAAFRGALGTVAAQAFGPRWGRALQATAFGLSHVADARGARESMIGTVLVTAAAGWGFGWSYDRSGSLAAPMLAHLAINETGAVAALVVGNQTSRLSAPSR